MNKSNTYLCTSCCKDKSEASGEIPSIERYKSERIRSVYQISKESRLPMLIFSGKFGILKPETPIPYYDKKLKNEEVPAIVEILKNQLKELNINKIKFYARPLKTEGWEPYYNAIYLACKDLEIDIKNIIIDMD